MDVMKESPQEYSAGAILIFQKENLKRLCLVKHRDETYVFPKGHIELNEKPQDAALREIIEETGYVNIEILRELGVIFRQSLKSNNEIRNKKIIMFLANLISKDRNDKRDEISEWFTYESALKKLRYAQDREFLINNREIFK